MFKKFKRDYPIYQSGGYSIRETGQTNPKGGMGVSHLNGRCICMESSPRLEVKMNGSPK